MAVSLNHAAEFTVRRAWLALKSYLNGHQPLRWRTPARMSLCRVFHLDCGVTVLACEIAVCTGYLPYLQRRLEKWALLSDSDLKRIIRMKGPPGFCPLMEILLCYRQPCFLYLSALAWKNKQYFPFKVYWFFSLFSPPFFLCTLRVSVLFS